MKKEYPLISIIVTVYGVEDYLSQCIDSILNQMLSDFELILVDDGSPDGSAEMCDTYARTDERVMVFHHEDKGLSAARNTGLDRATGKYIAFVDSDDYIAPDYLEKLVAEAEKKDADMAVCGHIAFQTENSRIIYQRRAEESLITFPENIHVNNEIVVWSKLFKRAFLTKHGIVFTPGFGGEDLPFTLFYSLAADTCACADTFYYYRKRKNSITTLKIRTMQKRIEERSDNIDAVHRSVALALKICTTPEKQAVVAYMTLKLYCGYLKESLTRDTIRAARLLGRKIHTEIAAFFPPSAAKSSFIWQKKQERVCTFYHTLCDYRFGYRISPASGMAVLSWFDSYTEKEIRL